MSKRSVRKHKRAIYKRAVRYAEDEAAFYNSVGRTYEHLEGGTYSEEPLPVSHLFITAAFDQPVHLEKGDSLHVTTTLRFS